MRTAIAAALCLIASPAIAADAIKTAIVYDGAAFDDLVGGLRRGGTYLGTLRLQTTFATPGGLTAYIEGLNIHGGQPSEFAGDAQGVSNLAAPSRSRIEEAWVQQSLFDSRASILVGRYDLNTEFDRTQSAGLFLNSSFGIGPEISQTAPSIFPNTSIGARVAYRPVSSVLIRAAAFDGMSIGEVAYLRRPSATGETRSHRLRLGRFAGVPPYTAKIAAGVWRSTDRDSSGLYVVGDEKISSRISAFGQIGVDRSHSDPFARYTGAGVAMTAPLRGRSNDETGIAVASVRNRSGGSETTIEGAYLASIHAHLAIQGDIQYVVHPASSPTTRNALVTMVEFELSF